MQRKFVKPVIVLVGAGLLGLYQHFHQPVSDNGTGIAAPVTVSGSQAGNAGGLDQIRAAQNDPDARFWVTVQGKVVKNLRDDRDGSAHQRFLLEVAPDITLLVAHNIDLARWVPVQEGSKIIITGEYVWNKRGGVLHWTHHDPRGRQGGWIELNGQRYE